MDCIIIFPNSIAIVMATKQSNSPPKFPTYSLEVSPLLICNLFIFSLWKDKKIFPNDFIQFIAPSIVETSCLMARNLLLSLQLTVCLSVCLYIAFSIDATCSKLRWLQLFFPSFFLNRVLSHHWSHSFRNHYSSLGTCLSVCGFVVKPNERFRDRASERNQTVK